MRTCFVCKSRLKDALSSSKGENTPIKCVSNVCVPRVMITNTWWNTWTLQMQNISTISKILHRQKIYIKNIKLYYIMCWHLLYEQQKLISFIISSFMWTQSIQYYLQVSCLLSSDGYNHIWHLIPNDSDSIRVKLNKQ
jgi:hypothetical protein